MYKVGSRNAPTLWERRLLHLLERYGLPRSAWEALAAEWIFSERDRRLFTRHYLDGLTFEALAEEADMSTRHVKRICGRHLDRLRQHL